MSPMARAIVGAQSGEGNFRCLETAGVALVVENTVSSLSSPWLSYSIRRAQIGRCESRDLVASVLILCAVTITHGGENQTDLDFIVATIKSDPLRR